MNRYDINTNAEIYRDNFPHDFKDRSRLLKLSTKSLNVYLLSLEDLVVSKIVSPRPKDLYDIQLFEVTSRLNWDLLDALFKDKLGDLLNERIMKDAIYEYDKYVKEFKK